MAKPRGGSKKGKGKTFFEMRGLKRWKKALEASGYKRISSKNIRKATALNGKMAEHFIRKEIQNGRFVKNAALTIAIKKSKKPLVHKGDLFQSITSKLKDDYTVFVGVLKSDKKNSNILKIVHEGARVKVTPRMRNMFNLLFNVTILGAPPDKLTGRAKELYESGAKFYPLKKGTRIIRIPPRPFLSRAMSRPQLRQKAKENWKKALDKTFRDIVADAKKIKD